MTAGRDQLPGIRLPTDDRPRLGHENKKTNKNGRLNSRKENDGTITQIGEEEEEEEEKTIGKKNDNNNNKKTLFYNIVKKKPCKRNARAVRKFDKELGRF